jgi:hypothetical protein
MTAEAAGPDAATHGPSIPRSNGQRQKRMQASRLAYSDEQAGVGRGAWRHGPPKQPPPRRLQPQPPVQQHARRCQRRQRQHAQHRAQHGPQNRHAAAGRLRERGRWRGGGAAGRRRRRRRWERRGQVADQLWREGEGWIGVGGLVGGWRLGWGAASRAGHARWVRASARDLRRSWLCCRAACEFAPLGQDVSYEQQLTWLYGSCCGWTAASTCEYTRWMALSEAVASRAARMRTCGRCGHGKGSAGKC